MMKLCRMQTQMVPLLLLVAAHLVHGQRAKEGCYDASPSSFTCAGPRSSGGVAEEVCSRLFLEVFANNEIKLDPSLHVEFLNSIDASSEFCTQIQQYYHECFFCAPEDWSILCFSQSIAFTCTDSPDALVPKLSAEEVLADNTNPLYVPYQTQEDIDAMCTDLNAASPRPLFLNLPFVDFYSTTHLCQGLISVKHLCPGTCDGGCFDAVEYPPTCNPYAYQGPVDETLDIYATCEEIAREGFFVEHRDKILEVDQHHLYLSAIEGNSTFCNQARQAYPDCLWCQTESQQAQLQSWQQAQSPPTRPPHTLQSQSSSSQTPPPFVQAQMQSQGGPTQDSPPTRPPHTIQSDSSQQTPPPFVQAQIEAQGGPTQDSPPTRPPHTIQSDSSQQTPPPFVQAQIQSQGSPTQDSPPTRPPHTLQSQPSSQTPPPFVQAQIQSQGGPSNQTQSSTPPPEFQQSPSNQTFQSPLQSQGSPSNQTQGIPPTRPPHTLQSDFGSNNNYQGEEEEEEYFCFPQADADGIIPLLSCTTDIFTETTDLLTPEEIEDVCYRYSNYRLYYDLPDTFIPKNAPFCDILPQVYSHCITSNCTDVSGGVSPSGLSDKVYYTLRCDTPLDDPIPPGFVSITLSALNLQLPDGVDPSDQSVDWYDIGKTMPCDRIYQYWDANWKRSYSLQYRYDDVFLERLCPNEFNCAGIVTESLNLNYLGATTTSQKRALIWLSRVSAMLSFFGALYVLCSILRQRSGGRNNLNGSSRSSRGSGGGGITVYHQLLLGMAIFDMITALAWCFATAPIDANDPGADHIEGAMGTEATCKAQGFFVQLGFTSIFYNVSLALYYVLVVVYSWREFQLQRLQAYLHALPLILGFGLALGGIPIYKFLEYGCHVLPLPEGDLWAVLLFVVVPLGGSIMAITASMMMVYCSVRQQAQAASKWSFGVGGGGRNNASRTMEQTVFWQCLFHMLAFVITWPIMFSVYLASIDLNGPLGLSLTVAFVAPLQGFSNFLVYLWKTSGQSTKPQRQSRTNSAEQGHEQNSQEQEVKEEEGWSLAKMMRSMMTNTVTGSSDFIPAPPMEPRDSNNGNSIAKVLDPVVQISRHLRLEENEVGEEEEEEEEEEESFYGEDVEGDVEAMNVMQGKEAEC